MTKEEILNKHDTSRGYIEQTCRPELFAAMDELAVRFGRWIQKCNYAPTTHVDTWQNQLPGENDIITTEELYEMFSNQNK